jgi:hypothetical protein
MFKFLFRSGLAGCAIAAISAPGVRAELFSQTEFSATEQIVCNNGSGSGEDYLKLNIRSFRPLGKQALNTAERVAVRAMVLVDSQNKTYRPHQMGKQVTDACKIPRSTISTHDLTDEDDFLQVPVKFLIPAGTRPMYLLIKKEGTQAPIKVRL